MGDDSAVTPEQSIRRQRKREELDARVLSVCPECGSTDVHVEQVPVPTSENPDQTMDGYRRCRRCEREALERHWCIEVRPDDDPWIRWEPAPEQMTADR